ncbi:hypothetical protein DVH24_026008 [Malus domestica]|uniref:Enolpyruvate transferase domain-containing protein n=1 Tax=Malus domestica TaxID=3750 RepID=A0A498KMI0_MALDO|nr:hypothetical protein DVH24_026008 [Malus domestica]
MEATLVSVSLYSPVILDDLYLQVELVIVSNICDLILLNIGSLSLKLKNGLVDSWMVRSVRASASTAEKPSTVTDSVAAHQRNLGHRNNLLDSDDIHYMIGVLKIIGINVEEDKAHKRAFVEGCGGRHILDRVPGMRERPIGDMVAGLKQLGADADCFLGTNCLLSVKLSGSVSSVYWTSLLMESPLALGDIEIDIVNRLVSSPFVEMTLKIDFSSKAVKSTKSPGNAFVEGDASSASYFLAGAAVIKGTVTVEGCAYP